MITPVQGKRFATGFVIGIFISMITVANYSPYRNQNHPSPGRPTTTTQSRRVYPLSTRKTTVIRHDVNVSTSSISFSNSHSGLQDDTRLADVLKKHVRVLIWVMTYSFKNRLKTITVHVKTTWGRRANKVVFVSSKNDTEFPAVGWADLEEGMNHLVEKTQHAFRYLYENHFHEADWFMKADDDTYVIVENLRYFLADKNPEEPVYYGQKMENRKFGVFPGGGGGYVMSREALRRVATRGRERRVGKGGKVLRSRLCRQQGKTEDVAFAYCMTALGVRFGDSTDGQGQHTFFALHPEKIVLRGGLPQWYKDVGHKDDKVSHFPISFHHMSPERMHRMEFFLYYVRIYGIQFGHKDYDTAGQYSKS